MCSSKQVLRVGIGGPVGSGKTALLEMLCKAMRERYEIAVITNAIDTQEDAKILNRAEALSEDRIMGVETGGCPHTAIREASVSKKLSLLLNMRGCSTAHNHIRRETFGVRDAVREILSDVSVETGIIQPCSKSSR